MSNLDLNIFLGKRIIIHTQTEIKIEGILRGFDQFMNIVIDHAVFYKNNTFEERGTSLIRGNQILTIEKYDEN